MSSAPPREIRPEFPYLDGIRGASSLLIVLYHAFLFTGATGAAVAAMPVWHQVIGYGYLGVPIFIVLSGYVLMLPLVRTDGYRFSGGVGRFLGRRARRILPPYYAALVFFILLTWLLPILNTRSGTQWDGKLPLSWGSIVSHLLMVHDFFPQWIEKIDGPLWSVAVEFQIYFLMPLVFIPLWRRIPKWIVVGIFALVTFVLPVFVPHLQVLNFMHPWLVGLFVFGMWAADLSLGSTPSRRLLWLPAAGVISIAVGVVITHFRHVSLAGVLEFTVGITVAGLLAWLGRRTVETGRPPAGVRPFAAPIMLRLGLVSYSIYLFHSPLLGLANLLLRPLGLPIVAEYLVMTFAVVPVVVAICVGFFWLVERHFLNRRQRHAVQELEEHTTAGEHSDTGADAVG